MNLLMLIIGFLPLAILAWDYKKSGTDWTATCHSGKSQSPININTTAIVRQSNTDSQYLVKFTFQEVSTQATMGYGFYKIAGELGKMSITKDSTYILNGTIFNSHFHSSGENALDGYRYDLELHLVMEDPEKSYSHIVFAVFFTIDDNVESEFLNEAIAVRNTNEKYSLNAAFDSTTVRDFYIFSGSLTSPPCTENAFWIVDTKVLKMTSKQFGFFNSMWKGNTTFAEGKGNSRQYQPLNNRIVTYYTSISNFFQVIALWLVV